MTLGYITYSGGEQSTEVRPTLFLTNTSSQLISLAKVSLRYYFTVKGEGAAPMYLESKLCDRVKGDYVELTEKTDWQLVTMTRAATNADTYLEVTFADDLTLLPNNGLRADVRIRLASAEMFYQPNDYSFQASPDTIDPHDRVVITWDGRPVAGTPPTP